jgi:hypothetical protein
MQEVILLEMRKATKQTTLNTSADDWFTAPTTDKRVVESAVIQSLSTIAAMYESELQLKVRNVLLVHRWSAVRMTHTTATALVSLSLSHCLYRL